MLAIVVFILVISAFSFFAAFRLKKTFEQTIPVACMSIMLFLFLSGMINILGIGWILVCLIAIGLYVYTIYWIIRNKPKETLKNNIFNLITPGFVVFAITSFMLAYFNKGRLATHTDEFSHWLDTVVIMTRLDAFGTAKGSTAIFPSYPPAMSLFQYLLEKINMVCTGTFSEWKTYFAYQLFAVAIMLPFIETKGKTLLKKIVSIVSWPICLVTPLYFFAESYNSLYIDPFLGVLGGCGFAAVSVWKNKDWLYNTYVAMLCATLTLSKDVGVYLAIFVALYYMIDYVARNGISLKETSLKKTAGSFALGLLPIAVMIAAKLLWKIELAVSDTTQKFSQPFDISGTIATIKGNGTEFTTAVYDAFRQGITYRYVYYERIGLNYTAIMFLFTIAFICLQVSAYRRGQLKKASAIAGAIIPSVAIIAYILSMFPLYISRFVEEEALNLASFDRYCGIMFLTGLLYMVWLLRDMLDSFEEQYLALILVLLMLPSVCHSKSDTIEYYTSRRSVDDSIEFRAAVDLLSNQINEKCEENSNILLIDGDGDNIYSAILSTISKPRSFTESNAYFSNALDESGTGISQSDLLDTIESNYDYVAIYRANDNLMANYSGIFTEPSQISNLSLYSFDAVTGKLSLVE